MLRTSPLSAPKNWRVVTVARRANLMPSAIEAVAQPVTRTPNTTATLLPTTYYYFEQSSSTVAIFLTNAN